MKERILGVIAKASYATAKKAGNSASVFGMHQPKEPVSLKNKRK